jgi:NAD(P)-dependent dehydrogenase (short-subunit alcohol dehydrogenase family)
VEERVKRLGGRVAVVTGGASGIGLAMAHRFGEEGMRVVLADVEAPALEKAASELAGAGFDVAPVVCDVRSFDAVSALADAALARFGAVHVVCNNAGVGSGSSGPMWEHDLRDWDWALGVNVMGVVHGIRAFVPILLRQDDEGHVVNTSSGNGGIAPLVGTPIYAASKSAVTVISECLYGQLAAASDKVKVSVLYPGPNWMRTNIWTSERNRPSELAQAKPSAAPRPSFDGLREQMRAAGLPFEETPLAEIAEGVVRGLREERFWMLPASERTDASIQARARSMLERSNPEYMLEKRPPAAGGLARE